MDAYGSSGRGSDSEGRDVSETWHQISAGARGRFDGFPSVDERIAKLQEQDFHKTTDGSYAYYIGGSVVCSDGKPLSREEVISVIEGRGDASRVPSTVHFWVHLDRFGDAPDSDGSRGHNANVVIKDWRQLDKI